MITYYDGDFKLVDATEVLLEIFLKVRDSELKEFSDRMFSATYGDYLWLDEYPCTYGGRVDGYHVIHNGHITL